MYFRNESFKRHKGFEKSWLWLIKVIEIIGQKTPCGLCSEWPFQFSPTSWPNNFHIFSPRILSSSKRKMSIKVLNYNVLVWCVVINKLDLKKCCTKKKRKAQCPRYWRSTIGKTEYFITGRIRSAMTIVSSILKLQDHSNLWIFIIRFLLLLRGNLSWAQNTD